PRPRRPEPKTLSPRVPPPADARRRGRAGVEADGRDPRPPARALPLEDRRLAGLVRRDRHPDRRAAPRAEVGWMQGEGHGRSNRAADARRVELPARAVAAGTGRGARTV